MCKQEKVSISISFAAICMFGAMVIYSYLVPAPSVCFHELAKTGKFNKDRFKSTTIQYQSDGKIDTELKYINSLQKRGFTFIIDGEKFQ